MDMYKVEPISAFIELECELCQRESCKTPNGMYKVTLDSISKFTASRNRNVNGNPMMDSDDESEDEPALVRNLCSMCCDEVTKTNITGSQTVIFNPRPLYKRHVPEVNIDSSSDQ